MKEMMLNVATMTSREIAELTGKLHSNVCRDIREMLKSLYDNDDSVLNHQENQCVICTRDNRGYVSEYKLDKDHTLTLLTGYDVKARHRVMKRWQELEAKLAQPNLPDFTNPAAAARAWADEYEAKLIAQAQLEAAQPAIEFHDRVGNADSLHSIDELAKALRAPVRKTHALLKQHFQLFRQDGLPKQEMIARDYMRVIEVALANGKVYPQAFFTGKGMLWIQRKIDHELLGTQV